MIGKKVSQYKIIEKLGSGGMGVVYKAEDTKLKRSVALKFLLPEITRDPKAKERLVHEARAISELDHPNICTIYEIDEAEGQIFITMEYVEGESLHHRLVSQSLKPDEVLDYSVQISDAVAEAHAHGVIHGGLNPQNVMLTAGGGVKVMDFALAKAITEQGGIDRQVETLVLTSTLAYSSPEQVLGEELDARSDIFSLGMIIYEMITGHRLLEGETLDDVTATLVNEEPSTLIKYETEVPVELDRIVRKALAKNREHRYQTAKELFIDLEKLKHPSEQTELLDQIEPLEVVKPSVPSPGASLMVADYRIIRKLGEGGMGVVYEAEQQRPRRPVALKVIRGAHFVDEYQVKLFQREAEALARLKHPGIASIYEAGCTDAGQHFFAMELVQGVPLTDYVKGHRRDGAQEPLGIKKRLELFLEICDAINYAHQRGVIHRDLKPNNILVTGDSERDSTSSVTTIGPKVKVLDFGLARITEADADVSVVSEVGQIKGTLPYMSPEQVRGNPEEIDLRSDVYALGVILYELLTDKHPYDVGRTTLPEAIRVICEEPPTQPSRVLREERAPKSTQVRRFNRDVETIVLKALEKDPERRYQSAMALADDMQRYLTNRPILARPPSTMYQLRKLVARHKALFSFLTALFVLLVGFAITMTVQSARVARERDRAVEAERLEVEQRDRAEKARNAEREQRLIAEGNLKRALEAEKIAADEAGRARTEAETAKQVSSFLVGLFEVSDPSEARGKTITAREILDKGAKEITDELKDQPVIQARLMDTIGTIYQSLGLYDSAAPLLEAALKIRQKNLGDEHPDLATSLNDLAGLLYYKGEYEVAEPLFRKALEMRRKLLGEDHPDVATSLNNLALVLKAKGDYDGAESLFRKALAMWRKLLGNEHPGVANSLNNLAVVLKAKGDYEEAEKLYREALAMRRKLLGDDHPDVATSLNDLAVVLEAKGDYDEAESFLREALTLRRKLLGDEHPDLATSLNDLAVVLESKGDYEGAEKLYREALAMWRKLLGDDHPDVATIINNLALVLEAKGDYEGAESLFREALAMWRRLLGNEHPSVAKSLNNLALVLEARGDYEEAEKLYREALAMWRKLLGDEHPNVATTMNNLALVLEAKGDYDSAESFLREALAMWQKLLGDEHQYLASSLNNLGLVLEAKGNYKAAEKLYRQALAMRSKLLGKKHPDVALSLVKLGKLLTDKGDLQEAELLLRECLEILQKSLPKGHRRTAEAESVLGSCLTALKRYQEAEPLLVESYSIIKAKSGEQSRRTVEALKRIIDLYEAWDKPDKASTYRTMLKKSDELPGSSKP